MNLFTLLHRAQSQVNYPKLRVIPFDHIPGLVLMFTIAGERASVPGSINITTDHEVFDRRVFFGRILNTGEISLTESITHPQVTLECIQNIDSNLEKYIRKTSYTSGSKCPMCWNTLQDNYSKLVGWGPDCAEKWGLQWTNQNSEEFTHMVNMLKPEIKEVLSNTGKYDPYIIFGKIKKSTGKSLDNLTSKNKNIVEFINQSRKIENWLSRLINVINSKDFEDFIKTTLLDYHNTSDFIILEHTERINDVLKKWDLFKKPPNSLKKIYNPLFLGPLWNQYVVNTVNTGKIILNKKLMFTM